jgi:hypothetical protein
MNRKFMAVAVLLFLFSAASSQGGEPLPPSIYPGATPDSSLSRCKNDEKDGIVIVGCFRTGATVEDVAEFYSGLMTAGPCQSRPECTFAKGIYQIVVWSEDMTFEKNRLIFVKAKIEISRCDQLIKEGKIIKTGCKPVP